MYLIFLIALIFQIVHTTSNCESIIKIEKCENRKECQIMNQKCVNRFNHCDQIQNVSQERCKKFNCDYDQLLKCCKTSYLHKSSLEQKIQESTKHKLGQHKHKQYKKSDVNQQEIYSNLDINTIKQQISQINNTQFEQLNFIINFAATLSLSFLIINLILQ